MVSCIIHCLLLIVLGLSGILSFPSTEAEQVIELDLVNDVVSPELASINTAVTRSFAPAGTGKVESTAPNNSDSAAPEVATSALGTESPVIAVSNSAGGPNAVGAATSSGNKTVTAGGRLVPPRILQKVEPVYPDEMRRQGTSGTVIVRIEVLENGSPDNVSIQRSSGFTAFDEAALQATRQWRFIPARDEATGVAVRCYTTLSIVFRLN
jgi:periplasmic protein TonB